jgi:hypothetical protein
MKAGKDKFISQLKVGVGGGGGSGVTVIGGKGVGVKEGTEESEGGGRKVMCVSNK